MTGLAPEPGQRQRQEAANASINFQLEGKVYTIRPAEVAASLAREYRKETGGSFRSDLALLQTDADLDTLQNLIWLARRQAGEHVTLDDIDDFTYEQTSSLKFVDEEAEEDPDSPEA